MNLVIEPCVNCHKRRKGCRGSCPDLKTYKKWKKYKEDQEAEDKLLRAFPILKNFN